MRVRRDRARKELAKDILLIVFGVAIAIGLSKSGLLDWFIVFLGGERIASFVAGIFFTSVFTLAPATVALVHVAQDLPVHAVAIFGALGALCGDLVLFLFIRDRFTRDLTNALRPSVVKHFLNSFHVGFMKWLSPVLGAVIIASPLPDEFGLTLMGLSKVRIAILVPISLVMNWLGVYFIVWFSQII